VVWTVLSVPLPIRAAACEPIPTQLSERASTASAVAFTPCNGIPAGSLSFSSLVDQYQQISRLRLLSRPLGVSLWPDGPRSIVIRSSSSMTTSPSSIPLSVAIGLAAYGQHRGYPARKKVAPLELVSPHVRTLFATTGALFKMPTGKSSRTSDTRRTRYDIHTFPTSRSSHSPPLPPFHRMLIPCHIALTQVNDTMKFKPLYSLVHNPPRIRIIIEHDLPLRSS